MFGLRSFSVLSTSRRFLSAPTLSHRQFIGVSAFYSTASGKPTTPSSDVPLDTNSEDIPGFRQSGELATNYEIAIGKERYEHLATLQGKDPWETMKPIVLTQKGTKENPIQLQGVDPVFYVGCSGFPAGSHETVFLTLRDKKTVDRCPHCGQAFKYTQIKLDDEHH